MSSCNKELLAVKQCKSKICLIGGQETYKDEFQRAWSDASLSLQNKDNIGVNISRINYNSGSLTNYLLYLWNINCAEKWASYRTSFYNGTEAVIVFISELYFEQIKHYFSEIRKRLPIITIVFCIILEEHSKDEILEIFLEDEEIDTILQDNDVSVHSLQDPSHIFEQITTTNLQKLHNRKGEDKYFIDFIHVSNLLPNITQPDLCSDYYPPNLEVSPTFSNKRANVEVLTSYLKEFGLVDEDNIDSEWFTINSERFGRFSLFLRSGRVYLTPLICEKCKPKNQKKCLKFKKAPYFVCIEAKNEGWSNLKGIDQSELLVLSKIFALKSGKLPKEVLKQIYKLNKCVKKK